MIELFGISWHNGVFDIVHDSKSHEIVVPHDVIRNHEKA